MGTAERRERERQQRHDSIVEAAEKVFFSADTLQEVTMDDIAKEAELSKGTLYLYFKTKEDLIATIHMKAMAHLRNMFIDETKEAKTGLDILKIFGDTYINFAFTNPNVFRFMSHKKIFHSEFCEDLQSFDSCIKYGYDIFDMMTKAIELGMQDKTLRSDLNPKLTAINIYGQISGVLDPSFFADSHILDYLDEEVDSKELVTSSFALILKSICA